MPCLILSVLSLLDLRAKLVFHRLHFSAHVLYFRPKRQLFGLFLPFFRWLVHQRRSIPQEFDGLPDRGNFFRSTGFIPANKVVARLAVFTEVKSVLFLLPCPTFSTRATTTLPSSGLATVKAYPANTSGVERPAMHDKEMRFSILLVVAHQANS
jgi:hypothetical protein